MSFSAGSACLHLAHRITQLELEILQSATKSGFKRVSHKLFEEHSAKPATLERPSSTRDLMLFDVVWRVMRSTNTIYIHLPSSEQSSSRETLRFRRNNTFQFHSTSLIQANESRHKSCNIKHCYALPRHIAHWTVGDAGIWGCGLSLCQVDKLRGIKWIWTKKMKLIYMFQTVV